MLKYSKVRIFKFILRFIKYCRQRVCERNRQSLGKPYSQLKEDSKKLSLVHNIIKLFERSLRGCEAM